MDRNFPRALNAVLKHEGGYVNHPNDPGGPTNKGVTLANFRAYVKPGGTVEDLKLLTVEQAGIVYRRFYWDAVVASELPDGLDFAVFDYAVNSGPSRAVKHLQEILNVDQDGRVGPKTLAAVRSVDAEKLINALCDRRMAFLKVLKTWGTFGRGWARRVAEVRELALELAQQPEDTPKVIVEAVPPKDAEKTAPLNTGLSLVGAGGVISGFGSFIAGLHPVVQGGALLLIAVGAFVLWRDRASIAKSAKAILRGQA
jgi:lysozyme family protein